MNFDKRNSAKQAELLESIVSKLNVIEGMLVEILAIPENKDENVPVLPVSKHKASVVGKKQ